MPRQLPIFRFADRQRDAGHIAEIARELFDIGSFELDARDERMLLRTESFRVDVDRATGSVWAADERRLWRHDEPADLLSRDRSASIADRTVRSLELASEVEGDSRFELVKLSPGRTIAATRSPSSDRSVRQLDVQERYGFRVLVPTDDGAESVPVIGGGAKLSVTLGHEGRILACNSSWRPIDRATVMSPAIAREEADKLFEHATDQLRVESYDAELAYFARPGSAHEEWLYPVWVYRASAIFDKARVPLRIVTIPATEFGPFPTPSAVQPKRVHQRIERDALSGARRSYLTAFSNPFEAGASWIGMSGGLSGSRDNAQGFVDELSNDGWLINFNWGDANAWESDWRRNDDTWVDAADFVFYTGHANMDGWVLSNPDDGSLDFNETGSTPGSPGDLWGQQDLEWAVIAACGPLQDDVISAGGGDVLDRWEGAFDGLHILMGYGAITFDNEEEGKSVVGYARDGMPLIDAWFRAAREIQPSENGAKPPDGPDVWVGAMWVAKDTADPRNDHLWGHGSVSADPRSPSVEVCMWTTC